jgi:hypothetical protein
VSGQCLPLGCFFASQFKLKFCLYTGEASTVTVNTLLRQMLEEMHSAEQHWSSSSSQ